MAKKILWIVDGVGWGYDILSRAIEKELPGYEHIMLAKKRTRVICGIGEMGFICEDDKSFKEKINRVNADIIVSMNPHNVVFLDDLPNVIARISGIRGLQGWHR